QDKQKQQKSKIQDLNQMKQAKYNSLLQLKSVKKEKKVVMAQVDQDKEAAEQALDALEQASNDVAAQIRKIQEENRRKAEEAARKRNAESSSGSGSSGSSGGSSDSGYVEYNGVFKWPLPGHSGVSSEFGMRRHPVTGRVKLHTGIDIPASSGTTIVAAADGEVLFAGNNSAYGKMVIIDHGGGVSSVYAHMSSISMGGGQKVSKGERVGGVGSTGLSTGNHLHFEVREYGDPVSPWKYLK
ncbi:MAG: peptidoglycan DD-metalloendopeptidase family protein, partial [Clostridiales bacterium]